MRSLLHASLAGVLLVGSAGCLTLGPKVSEPLRMPEPPSHLVTPPTTPPPPEPTPATPTSTAPPQPASAGTGSTTTSPPPVTRPPQNTTTTTATPPASPPTPDAPVLQTTPETQKLDQEIQQLMASAKRDLGRVDRNRLSRDEKEQYDSARMQIKGAEDAKSRKNFNLALQYAQKAAQMAALLVKNRSSSPTSL